MHDAPLGLPGRCVGFRIVVGGLGVAGGYFFAGVPSLVKDGVRHMGNATSAERRREERTIRAMLPHDLHRAHNTRLFTVRVPEEGEVAFLHYAEVRLLRATQCSQY